MSILPAPISQEALPGQFTLPASVVLTYASERCTAVAEFAAVRLRERYGRPVTVQGVLLEGEALGALHLVCEPTDSLAGLSHNDEAYELAVGEGGCVLRALEPHGLFNGLQSLLLLLPAAPPPEGHDITIPATKASQALPQPIPGYLVGLLCTAAAAPSGAALTTKVVNPLSCLCTDACALASAQQGQSPKRLGQWLPIKPVQAAPVPARPNLDRSGHLAKKPFGDSGWN